METKKAKKKILVAEDDLFLQKLIVEELQDKGLETFAASDGEEALKVALKEHPDLILLDIIMPKVDGIEMLTSLRRDDWGENAKVVMLTNLSDSEKISECLEKGVDEYLVKSSLNLDDITAKVKAKLEEEETAK